MAALIPLEGDADAPLAPVHEKALRRAVVLLENPNFAAGLAEYAGQPVDKLLGMMPRSASAQFNRAVELAMFNCLKLAIRSIDPGKTRPPSVGATSLLAGVSGGVSGFFGIAALAVELPVTTTLMLRAIADLARHNGEDLSTLEARLACVEVFGLTNASSRKRLDVGYYASRALLTRLTQDASALLLERGVANAASTTVVSSFVTEIASRFGLVASERAAASALPVIGAVGGATVNVIFMNHFQRLAHGHFTIRRLERHYGSAVVHRRYEAARAELLKR
jgi:EcsC protein family